LPKQHRKPQAQPTSRDRGPGKGQLRIIGGRWRGRKLPIVGADGLRPTGDRIRETLFNWLAPTINNSVCLDLFTGSGALSFECLSRGGRQAIMIEKNALAARQLKQNSVQLQTNAADVIHQDALLWLDNQKLTQRSIDIVFIDPPFAYDLWDSAIDKLHHSKLLAPDALIYIESSKGSSHKLPLQWQLSKEKTAGDVDYKLYQNRTT
jgi:16S rRNA (guanine966-N2)-methyltransferase